MICSKKVFIVMFFASVFLGWSHRAAAAEEEASGDLAGTLQLDSLISRALENNPELVSLRMQIDASRARIPQARALEDPMFEMEIDSVPIDTLDPTEAMQLKYTASQRIPFRGKRSLQGEIASRSAQALSEFLRDKEKEVIRKVKDLYYQLYLLSKSTRINRDHKKILGELEEIARVKYSTGEGTQQDVLKAQVELASLDNDLIRLEQELESARAELNMILNRPSLAPVGTPPDLEYSPFHYSIGTLQEMALERRPLLLSFQNLIERDRTALSLSRKAYYPDFSTGFSYGQTSMGKDQWSLMVGVNIPLWHRKKQAFGIVEADKNLQASLADYEAARNLVLFEVRDAFLKSSSSFRKLELYRTGIIPQAEQSFKSAIAGYKTDLVDFLTLLDNWRTLLDYWLDYHSLLAQYQQDLSDLEFAAGGTLSETSGE